MVTRHSHLERPKPLSKNNLTGEIPARHKEPYRNHNKCSPLAEGKPQRHGGQGRGPAGLQAREEYGLVGKHLSRPTARRGGTLVLKQLLDGSGYANSRGGLGPGTLVPHTNESVNR
jgi:hypothetical protein